MTNRDLLKVFLRPDDAIRRRVVDVFSTVDGGTSSVLSVANRVRWLVDDTINAMPVAGY